MEKEIKVRGSGSVGMISAGFPLIGFTANRDYIIISHCFKKYKIMKDELTEIRVYHSIDWNTIGIEHNVPGFPEGFGFTFGGGFENFLKRLEALGYEIGEPRKTDRLW